MPSYQVPSNDGYVVIPLGKAQRKPVKSIHVYQDDEALNIDLEFDDKSILEMIFRAGFRATLKLSDYKEGNYILRKTIRPQRPKA
jgi:hypothetical protein